MFNLYKIWGPILQKVITARDIYFNENTFFNFLTEDLFIIIRKYCLLTETLTILDIIISDNLNINEFVINKNIATSL